MMKTISQTFAAAILGTAFLASTAGAKELPLAECPPAVQEIINANARGGKVDDVKAISVEDRTLYVADVDLPGGADLKIHVSGSGKLIKTREDVRLADTPAAVQAAVNKLVGEKDKVDDVEKEVAGGKTTYEVEIDRKKAADLNLVVAEDGTVVSQKEEAKD